MEDDTDHINDSLSLLGEVTYYGALMLVQAGRDKLPPAEWQEVLGGVLSALAAEQAKLLPGDLSWAV